MSNYKYYASTFALIELLQSLKKRNVTIHNLTSLIEQLVDSLKIKQSDDDTIDLVVDFIVELAKGPDGKLGTEDDLIPSNIIDDIKLMQNTSILKDIITLCTKNSKRKWYHIYMCCLKCVF